MKEVKAERDHRYDVKQRYPPDPETADDVRVHILMAENTSGPNCTGRKMENVKDNEDEYQYSAPTHRPGSDGRHLRLLLHISDWARRPRLPRQLHRSDHVQKHGDYQRDSQRP